MITDVLSEMAVAAAPAMRRAVELLAEVPARTDAWTWLLGQSKQILDFAGGYRDAFQARLEERGLDPRPFKKACEALAECLDAFLASVPRIREVGGRFAPVDREALLAELDRQESEAQNARLSFGEWLEAINRRLPPIDWKALEEKARIDREAGRYLRIETYEDLFGEPPE